MASPLRIASAGLALVAATAFLTACDGFFVSPHALVAIAVSPANSTIQPGATQQFTATGTFADHSQRDLSSDVTWASSSTSVATIDANGNATADALGTTTISASSGGITGSTSLAVSNRTISSIAISPANPSVSAGATQQFTATATFSDGSTGDVTNTVTWASSQTGVATIDASGLATTVAAGTTNITATSGGVTASTTLTVI